MYTPDQLQNIYGVGDPRAYDQAKAQVGITQQYGRGQAVKSEEAGVQAGLDSLFQRQNDPLKLQQSQVNLEGSQLDNVTKGVNSRMAVATEGFKLNEAKRAEAIAMPEHEIKMMTAHAQQLAYSDDPKKQAEGKRLMQLSAAAVEARQKHADEMEKQDVIRKSAERVGAGNNAATIRAAEINASARMASKQVDPNVVAAKLGFEKGAAYYAIQAEQASTPEERDQFLAMAKRFEQANLNQKNAGAGIKPDLNVLGIQTNQVPSALGGTPAQPPAPTAQPNVPQVGQVSKGYVYQGGDPSKQTSWKKQ